MAVPPELTMLHCTSESNDRTPLAAVPTPEATDIHVLDDTIYDPSPSRDADDEGLGGYSR